MANQTKTFSLNVHMHEDFDCDDVHLESRNLAKDFGPLVGSILTLTKPSTYESIATPSDLDKEANCMGGFEGSTHHESKSMGPSPQLAFPLAFFCGMIVVN